MKIISLTKWLLFLLSFSLFIREKAIAQQFKIDTAIAQSRPQVDTIPEITISGKRLAPLERIITYSTFTHNFLFHNRSITIGSSFSKKGIAYIFPDCIPINNEKGFAVQIDSIYIRGSNMSPDKVELYFNLYKENKRYQTQAATTFYRKKKLNVFVFEKGFRLPKGKSYLSFNYKFIDTPFDFKIKTNTRITGALYSYNEQRNEFKLTDSVRTYYTDKPNDSWMESTEDNPRFSSPQVKIFCSFIK